MLYMSASKLACEHMAECMMDSSQRLSQADLAITNDWAAQHPTQAVLCGLYPIC